MAHEIVGGGGMVLRRDEKKTLRAITEKLGCVRAKRGTAGTVATVADKAFQLLQVALRRLRIEAAGAAGTAAFSLRMETRTTAELAARIAEAFTAFCLTPEMAAGLSPSATWRRERWPAACDRRRRPTACCSW